MSKELFVTSTPHETKLAVVEDDQLVEVFFERENEYTLAGSIYKGKVTRVLPGMQSAFVDIGLERDAFLYVTDFLEEVESDEDDSVNAAPANGEQPAEGGEREERGGRGRGARRGRERGRRSEQHRAAQASELTPQAAVPETQASIEPDGNVEGEVSPASEGGESQQSTQSGSDRLPRRWRGRRGRRRGRSFLNESKYAGGDNEKAESSEAAEQESEEVPEIQASGEPSPVSHTEDGQDPFVLEHDATGAESEEDEEEEQSPPAAEVQHEPQRERQPERPRQPQRPQRIVLPGETLAKYNPRPEQPAVEKGAETASEARLSKPAPRPSTEVSIAPGSLSAGVLAGESIAKYRNRPAPTAAPEKIGESRSEHRLDEAAAGDKDYDVHAAHVAAEKHRHEPVSEAPEHSVGQLEAEAEQQTETGQGPESETPKGEYNFSPGSGVIEEEEIAEEEHELLEDAEDLEDHEFEELEEETLEEDEGNPHENKFIAASEGLAAALMESRDPTKANSYVEQDDEETEESDEAPESSIADAEVDESGGEREELEESLTLEGGYQGPELDEPESDPEDPNYSARAETRGPLSTAGYQQRTERGGRDSERGYERGRRGRRGGRPQRGGRPMRGGPRRNIPRGPMPQINELLKEGQEILVQIAKEPMAKKGARITSHIALPGRFLVFMPTVNHTGVSRKIGSDEERQRLKRILISEKGQSHGGFIVRTAAAGASEEDLRADIRFLINLWNEIKQRAETSKAPALIYHDLNLVERILRDQVTTTFSQIWVDNENEYERILKFASRFQPSLVRRVKLYSKETPLFEEFAIQDEINKALKSKVWLKSGGYIVINQTEALVAIDINTGKYVGKTARLEDTIVKTNIDAIKEIVRQIRLRDLGGIIVIDFIDMDERRNRQRVMQALEEALKADRSPSKVLQFNDFGLVAITRKRVKQSLERTLGTQCTYCTGTGMIKSVATVCNEIYVELRKMGKHFDNHQITLRVNPEVGKALKENGGRWLLEMEELTKKTILVKNDPAQHQEQFDIH